MILKMIDQKIRNAFSSAAYEYDVLTSLHKEIGRELFKKAIDYDDLDSIVDIGMGTGWLTHRMKFFLPESTVVGMDFASGMIEQAKNKYDDFFILQADGRSLPFKDRSVDLIMSNLALQWVRNLEDTFVGCRRVLKDNGKIHMTMFGHDTFKELFTSLDQSGSTKEINVQRLASVEQVKEAIKKAGFSDVQVDFERIKVRFPDMFGLLKWIKEIGANCLGNDTYLGRESFTKANDYYIENYKDRLGVYATLEVIWVEAHV